MAASTRTSFTAAAGGGNNFTNSKFFMKKQHRAATQIQAMCRAFLVQARLHRAKYIEPLLKDLKDCETRKQEELKRIQDQFEEERTSLPEKVKKEVEDSAYYIENLKKEIEIFTKVGEELKEGRKEEKRKNNELQLEAKKLKDEVFKLDVANMKLANEVKDLKETAEKYQWALEGGKMQLDELEKAVLKACHQQGVFTKYMNRIIKKVEEASKGESSSTDAGDASPPASPPKPRRKSLEKRKSLSKKLSAKDLMENELTLLDLISSEPKDRRKTMSKSNIFAKDQAKSLHQARSKRRQSVKEAGNASFNWETYNDSKSEGADAEHENSIEDLLADQPEDQACFDWATKSYNFEVNGAETDETQGRRKPRRHTSAPMKSLVKSHHSSSKTNKAMKELAQELKEVKKQGLKSSSK